MKYKVTVSTIVEADSEEEAAEHLWDGATEIDVELIDEQAANDEAEAAETWRLVQAPSGSEGWMKDA